MVVSVSSRFDVMCASVAECFLLNIEEAQKKYGQSQTFTFGKLVGKIGAFSEGTIPKESCLFQILSSFP